MNTFSKLIGSVASLIGGMSIAVFFLVASYLFYVGQQSSGRWISIISSVILAGLGAYRYTIVEKKTLPIVFMTLGVLMLVIQFIRSRSSGDVRKTH